MTDIKLPDDYELSTWQGLPHPNRAAELLRWAADHATTDQLKSEIVLASKTVEVLFNEHTALTVEVERLRGEVAEYKAKERHQLEIAKAEIESDDTDYDNPDRYMRTG